MERGWFQLGWVRLLACRPWQMTLPDHGGARPTRRIQTIEPLLDFESGSGMGVPPVSLWLAPALVFA
jgi:hypothetical protein